MPNNTDVTSFAAPDTPLDACTCAIPDLDLQSKGPLVTSTSDVGAAQSSALPLEELHSSWMKPGRVRPRSMRVLRIDWQGLSAWPEVDGLQCRPTSNHIFKKKFWLASSFIASTRICPSIRA